MDTKFHYHVDPEAIQRLAGHIEFLARVSAMAAEQLYREYESAIRFIEDNAPGCPVYHSPKLPDVTLRGWLFGKRYRIVFEIIGTDVFAYDIQDCRQDTDKNLI